MADVELVYFDIHARGELTRLCYAAAGRSDYTDTRIPLFMETPEAARTCEEIHRPRAPFAFFPYLNVRRGDGTVQQVSGDGVVECFVARRLGLLGADETAAGVCSTITHAAVALGTPALTEAGLHGRAAWVYDSVQPNGHIGQVLTHLERYLGRLGCGSGSVYVVGSGLTVADLAIFNALDECLTGPRGDRELAGVKDVMLEHYPQLMQTHAVVAGDLADYLTLRQERVAVEAQAKGAARVP
eukprot:NODE_1329_length_1003_cov_62.671908_g1024_i0.p1 GENE.NODE_1329_length_1003_cov_62.671908_g1024_i0~~NODE_1329_length_1003_cov_62.671908_g1024_i0.p1  ORF type:complete len:242 (-),score=40.47 NODE_1329_length_1003_cov_62.671908_g1024_i0:192-917(-)